MDLDQETRDPGTATWLLGTAAPTATFHGSEIRQGLNPYTKAIPGTEITFSIQRKRQLTFPGTLSLGHCLILMRKTRAASFLVRLP